MHILWIETEQVRDLFDDHVVNEIRQVIPICRAKFERSPVEHNSRRKVDPAGPAGQQPRQRNIAVLEHIRVVDVEIRGHFLDCELDAGQFARVPPLQRLDGIQDKIIKNLRPGTRQRHRRGHQPTA